MNPQLNDYLHGCKLWLMREVLELVTRKGFSYLIEFQRQGGQEICCLEVFKMEGHATCLVWANRGFCQAWE